jgi:phage shock protein PspC (stress-responsive transcriptional regulator)
MAGKKLCKLEKEGKISGVCAGLAYYFNFDVTIVRLIWALAILFGVGSPILIYIVLAIILPECDPDAVEFEEVQDDEYDPYDDSDRYE